MAGMSIGTEWFIQRPAFGRAPRGSRLARIQSSPNYRNGQFQCLEPVESIMEHTNDDKDNRLTAIWKFLFGDKTGLVPAQKMVSKKTDIQSLESGKDVVIWMGHSTFYMQLAGKRILLDPVFSDYASPIFFVNKAFAGSNIYTADDFPEIDILVISHDHWDHLDYPSVMALKDKVKAVVCPLGVGEYFEQWGFPLSQLYEADWFSEIKLADDFRIHVLPSQHFSGRFLQQNITQWAGFAFITPNQKVFFSGDGGYGGHFKKIGEMFGGFDLALMENGQYNKQWHRIHMMPEETAQAAADLGAKTVIPAHSGKFALARHNWDTPYRDLAAASVEKSYTLLTPEIGELVYIGQKSQQFGAWWKKMT